MATMSTEQDIKYIERLVECFFDGITTTAEEKILYHFFEQEDIPKHLEPYREVFAYFDGGMANECKTLPKEEFSVRQFNKKRWMLLAGGIAASLLLFVPTGLRINANGNEFNPYEGSYIVRNGVRTDNPKVIRAELQLVMGQVERQHERWEHLFESVSMPEKKANLLETDIKREKEALLKKFEDEKVREMVRKMLE